MIKTTMAYRAAYIAGLLAAVLIYLSSSAWAVTVTPFGPHGEGGHINGQTLSIGTGGQVFQIDAFLNITGMDLNGFAHGTSAQLSTDTLPWGLDYTFSASLSPDATDMTISYTFINNTGGILNNVQFFSFLDAEIDEPLNTYFNEYGETSGTSGLGAADANPDSWEIDEPGFTFGNIFDNLMMGTLDNMNTVSIGFPDDVSMVLGFQLGDLNPLNTATISILISEDGNSLGSFALSHHDNDPNSTTVITLSGQSSVTTVPEPSALFLFVSGLVGIAILKRRFKSI